MKKFRIFLLVILMLPCVLLFGGCQENVYITRIEKTETVGSTDTYTIYYSDNTTSNFTVENDSDDNSDVYVTRIEKTETIGTTDTYTVYYSDNTTSNFTIENGADGENGTDVTIENIFQTCVNRGMYENSDKGFLEFLSDYLNFTVEDNNSINQAVVKAMKSAVSIYVEHPVNALTGTYPHISTEVASSIYCGAGVIYKMDDDYSYLITNYHVVYLVNSLAENNIARMIYAYQYGENVEISNTDVEDASIAPAIEFGGDGVECQYVGGSLNYDLAVLKVSTDDLLAVNPDAEPVTIASEYGLADTAIAIGNPEGNGISVTTGVVSVVSENITMTGADDKTEVTFRVMRIDAAVNGGNSGGGLFNDKGELIGIVNSKLVYSSDETPIDNISYALPYDNVTKVVDNIIHYHEATTTNGSLITPVNVTKLLLGINIAAENSQATYDYVSGKITITDDALVTGISSDSLAQNKGMQVGDIIESIVINKTEYEISRYYQVSDLLLTIRTGDSVIINVSRNNISQSIVIGEVTSDMLTTIL